MRFTSTDRRLLKLAFACFLAAVGVGMSLDHSGTNLVFVLLYNVPATLSLLLVFVVGRRYIRRLWPAWPNIIPTVGLAGTLLAFAYFPLTTGVSGPIATVGLQMVGILMLISFPLLMVGMLGAFVAAEDRQDRRAGE